MRRLRRRGRRAGRASALTDGVVDPVDEVSSRDRSPSPTSSSATPVQRAGAPGLVAGPCTTARSDPRPSSKQRSAGSIPSSLRVPRTARQCGLTTPRRVAVERQVVAQVAAPGHGAVSPGHRSVSRALAQAGDLAHRVPCGRPGRPRRRHAQSMTLGGVDCQIVGHCFSARPPHHAAHAAGVGRTCTGRSGTRHRRPYLRQRLLLLSPLCIGDLCGPQRSSSTLPRTPHAICAGRGGSSATPPPTAPSSSCCRRSWTSLGCPGSLRAGAEPLDGPATVGRGLGARELGYRPGRRLDRRAGAEGQDKPRNTSVMVGPDGGVAATYRKIHLFDVEVEGVDLPRVRREAARRGGRGCRRRRHAAGPGVCYDLRFPELYRILAFAARACRGARRVHRPHRPRPLGGAAAGPRDREPGVRDRGRPDRRAPARPALRALDDRRPLGRGAGARRTTGSASWPPTSTSNPRTRCATTCPRCATGVPEAYRWPQLARMSERRERAPRRPTADKRRLILDAAIRVFARQGFHRCRVSDIADEAGVAYGLVYHYFDSKDEMLDTLFTERWTLLLEAIAEIDGRTLGRATSCGDRRVHHRLLPARPGADEGDHRRGHARREHLRPHPPAGDPPGLRPDRSDRRRRAAGRRRSATTSSPSSRRCSSTARSSSS